MEFDHMNCQNLLAIFFVKFHSTKGPQIRAQCPRCFISEEIFKAFDFKDISPKEVLGSRIIKFAFDDRIVVGYPIHFIDLSKYEAQRGVIRFNTCFVFNAQADTTVYECVIKKITNCFLRLEKESSFITNLDDDEMQSIIEKVYSRLKSNGCVQLILPDSTSLALKPETKSASKSEILLSDVPTLLYGPSELLVRKWDLISVRVIKLINGLRRVKDIIKLTNAESNLVVSCLRNLLHLKLVIMAPLFRFSNLYILTSRFNLFLKDIQLQQRCFATASLQNREHLVTVEVVSRVFSLISNSIPLKRIAQDVDGILDLRKLVQFGVVNGILHKLYKYPYLINPASFMEEFKAELQSSAKSNQHEFLTVSKANTSTSNVDTLSNSENMKKRSPERQQTRSTASVQSSSTPKVQSNTLPRNYPRVTISVAAPIEEEPSVEVSMEARLRGERMLDQIKTKFLDGSYHTEELACLFDVPLSHLESMLESSPHIVMYMN